jgi:bifunctional enzyme CysN/CysC
VLSVAVGVRMLRGGWMSYEIPHLRAFESEAIHVIREVAAEVERGVLHRIDVNTLHRHEGAAGLSLNEIGRLRLRLSSPLFLDEYRRNRATGSFILIDESTNDTVAAGMVL